jgi:hypothetical protein
MGAGRQGRGDHNSLIHNTFALEALNQGGNLGKLLPDSDVDVNNASLLLGWLIMVSTAMAVLPVWRSPMISSRWPRPIGPGVNCHKAGHNWLMYAFTVHNARSTLLNGPRSLT